MTGRLTAVSTVAGLVLFLASAAPVLAHAQLEGAVPRVGAHAAGAVTQVLLRYSEPIEPAFSQVLLLDPAGKSVPGALRVSPGDGRLVTFQLPRPLAPGAYRLRWRVLSVDGHRTQGEFAFSVGP